MATESYRLLKGVNQYICVFDPWILPGVDWSMLLDFSPVMRLNYYNLIKINKSGRQGKKNCRNQFEFFFFFLQHKKRKRDKQNLVKDP